jgi:hypothetical protein
MVKIAKTKKNKEKVSNKMISVKKKNGNLKNIKKVNQVVVKKNSQKNIKKISSKNINKKSNKSNIVKKNISQRLNMVKDKIVAAEAAFYCFDGKVYYCLKELCDGLGLMCIDTFSFHVNEQKNDFYNWIKHTFQEHKLSDSVLKCKTPKQMKIVIEKSLL